MSRGGRAGWITPLAVAALAAITALPSLWNRFVYDDVYVIVQNELVHSLASAPDIWRSGYWMGVLYRPLTIQLFSVEWALGGGHPMAFRAVSILLAVLTAVLVWRLARRLLEPLPAAVAAALFAVHPVHVESVANTVGQSELLTAVFTMLAVERYLAWRVQGEIGAARRLTLAALTLLAIFSKETGYAAPLLMGAAELTVFRAPRRIALPVFALQAAAVLAGLLVRLGVLGSLSGGGTPTAALSGLSFWDRAGGMLAIVPEWTRLLLWPSHLQAEYGPPALSVADAPAGARLLGAVLLLMAGALVMWSWPRRKAVILGVLWIALTLGPVSNLLAPTGIVLAERTLFLPSVGAVLLMAGLGGALADRLPPAVRRATAMALLALIGIAGIQSARRTLVWRSQSVFFARLEVEAPRTYRAQYTVSRFYYGERRFPEAERAARRALELYRKDSNVHDQLGQVLRTMGRCQEAVPIFAEGVTIAPEETTIRSRLIECSLAIGDTASARRIAEEAVRLGQSEFESTVQRLRPRGS